MWIRVRGGDEVGMASGTGIGAARGRRVRLEVFLFLGESASYISVSLSSPVLTVASTSFLTA